MPHEPVLSRYHAANRDEVFEFIREVFPAVFPAEVAVRLTKQWRWRYESNPFTPSDGPPVFLIRNRGEIIGLVAGFRLRMWMGGIECVGEGRGTWVVHPKYRGQNLWRPLIAQSISAPIQIGWSRLPARVTRGIHWFTNPVRPLIRVFNAGTLLARLVSRRHIASNGTQTTASVPSHLDPPLPPSQRGVIRLQGFDGRVDALWERARRNNSAMTIRDQRYLNWRFCERPDTTYILYGVERGSELEGFLVARATTFRGMRWGYLVDFLAPVNSSNVLSLLIGEAISELHQLGVVAVSCYATDKAARAALFRNSFFPVPQWKPIRFVHFLESSQTHLAKFAKLKTWYLTMGDGDLELGP
jgi:hypothetical protein